MAYKPAVWLATLLSSLFPFSLVLQVLDRSVFGSWDTTISIAHATIYSFGINFIFCAPIQLILPKERRGALTYTFSYFFGFLIISGIIDIYTTFFFELPIEKRNSLSFDEKFIGTVLVGIAMIPLAIATAGLFEVLMNLFARFFPEQHGQT